MKNNEIRKFSKLVLLVNLIILIVCSITLLIIQKYSWLIGYILGSVTSYITYLMHAHYADKFGDNNKVSTKKSVTNALLRIFISAIVLTIALFVDFIDIIATFIGLLVIKLTIFFIGFGLGIKKDKKGE